MNVHIADASQGACCEKDQNSERVLRTHHSHLQHIRRLRVLPFLLRYLLLLIVLLCSVPSFCFSSFPPPSSFPREWRTGLDSLAPQIKGPLLVSSIARSCPHSFYQDNSHPSSMHRDMLHSPSASYQCVCVCVCVCVLPGLPLH